MTADEKYSDGKAIQSKSSGWLRKTVNFKLLHLVVNEIMNKTLAREGYAGAENYKNIRQLL